MKQKPMGSDDIPVREPLHMVQCIYELMTMHSTVATGTSHARCSPRKGDSHDMALFLSSCRKL